MKIVSIDIGSTWTKGALFDLVGKNLRLVRRKSFPTTVDDLAVGFFTVLEMLLPKGESAVRAGQVKLFYSSSAKGGLAVAALGVVPDITLASAQEVACSAGAKLTSVFSYELTSDDIEALEHNSPDIILFAGGTDGGDQEYVLANVKAIADSSLSCTIVYAGNRSIQDEVSALLSNHKLIVVDNIQPSLDQSNPEPAREAIRSVFLSTIVKGKGLDSIVCRVGCEPLPTPYAMFELCGFIREHIPDWSGFMIFDLGGATTDVYTCVEPLCEPATVVRGLPEPAIKRSVEGDLGMRVSADSTVKLAKERLDNDAQFFEYTKSLKQNAGYLPAEGERHCHYDRLLAETCVATASVRHAGYQQEVFTTEGRVFVQVGRNLRGVQHVIGSGGYLASAQGIDLRGCFAEGAIDERGRQVLLPDGFSYYQDQHYLLPLLANVAQGYPEAAAQLAVGSLLKQEYSTDTGFTGDGSKQQKAFT